MLVCVTQVVRLAANDNLTLRGFSQSSSTAACLSAAISLSWSQYAFLGPPFAADFMR